MKSPTATPARATAAGADACLATVSGKRCRAMLGDDHAGQLLRTVSEWVTANRPALSPACKHLARALCGAGGACFAINISSN